jgi:sugar/nucleoside kinase (ribokinase family)
MVTGKRVLAVGDVNLDLLFTGLDRLPAAEQESLARGLEFLVGGQTGTVARALARLGLAVSFVGRVGDDDYGRLALRELSAAGVDCSGAVVDPALRTGVTVVLSTGSERAYATFPGSAAEARRSDVTAERLAGADHLHVGSYYLQAALRPELPGLFREARRRGLTTSLDPGWDPSGQWGKKIREVLPHVDLFLPNQAEAAAITGEQSPERTLAALTALAAPGGTVVVKMGAAGCLAGNRTEAWRCPAFRVKVVDVTSAGDVFDAGFLFGFLSGWDLAAAARFAGACGAIAVERAGSGGIVTGGLQVREFLSSRQEEAAPSIIPPGGRG